MSDHVFNPFADSKPVKWVVLGLDIGLSGCCAVLSDEMEVVSYRRTVPIPIPGKKPIKKTNKKTGKQITRVLRQAYGADLYRYIKEIDYPIVAAFVEEPLQMRQGQGGPQIQSSTITSLWHSLGVAEGILSCFDIKSFRIQPRAWKTKYALIGESKRTSVERAVTLNPELGSLLVKEADIAEAVLIARYGLMYQKEKYIANIYS